VVLYARVFSDRALIAIIHHRFASFVALRPNTRYFKEHVLTSVHYEERVLNMRALLGGVLICGHYEEGVLTMRALLGWRFEYARNIRRRF
jgi:hypothetical protein